MRMRRWPFAMPFLLAVACGGTEPPAAAMQQLEVPPIDAGPPPPLAVMDAAPPAPPVEETSTISAAPDEATLARDPRAAGPQRSTAAIKADISGLETQLQGLTVTSPDRPGVLHKLADAEAELGRNLGEHGGERPRQQAVSYAKMLIKDHPTYANLDAVRYYLGLAHERLNQLSQARSAYYELIKAHPSSRFIPCAYYAFGDMFMTDAESGDPTKYELAKQALAEVLKYPAKNNTCFKVAQKQLSAIPKQRP